MAEELAVEQPRTDEPLALSREEARGLMLAAQGLLEPPRTVADGDDILAMIQRLGVVQIDTINVVRRSQYLVLWSRLGAYDEIRFDALLSPRRDIFEYWAHAASILPVSDYPYYRAMMLDAHRHLYDDDRRWHAEHPQVAAETLQAIRDRGPLASADFERPRDGRRAEPWDWHGLKESRRALAVLWTLGEIVVHSRRGGQKVYDLRERFEAGAFPDGLTLEGLPTREQRIQYFTRRTLEALGVVVPSWLFNYFGIAWPEGVAEGNKRKAATALLERLVASGEAVRTEVAGLREPGYISSSRLPDLDRLRQDGMPVRTTFLSPFDSLIWHRDRARTLFDYEVCFEAYVVPEKRQYGYYCLAILHNGRLVGRLDPKMDRDTGQITVRTLYLELGVEPDAELIEGIAGALRDLARFLGARGIAVERTQPAGVAAKLRRAVGTGRMRK